MGAACRRRAEYNSDSGGGVCKAADCRNGTRRDFIEMPNRTEPKTLREWIRYVIVAAIAIFLVIWMLRLSGIG
jgi:hypothetical protein